MTRQEARERGWWITARETQPDGKVAVTVATLDGRRHRVLLIPPDDTDEVIEQAVQAWLAGDRRYPPPAG